MKKKNWDPKPKDNKTWWLASHCGPGTLDSNEICGFCGDTCLGCAARNTESISAVHEETCGGSGFWCKECGRFWAQDACGESNGEEHLSQDGAELSSKDGYVVCVCGNKLAKELESI